MNVFGGRSRIAMGAVTASFACSAAFAPLVAPASASVLPGAALVPASELDDKVTATRDQLAAASKAVTSAEAAVEAADKQMPGAEAKVASAQAAFDVAVTQQEAAKAAVKAAQAAVAAQKLEVDRQQAQIDALELQVEGLARQSYIGGGENQELEILLRTQDPSQFAVQMQAVRRTSQANSTLYDQLTAAKAEMDNKLAQLQRLKDQAAAQQRVADDRANDARNAKDSADAARQAVVNLISQRKTALNSAADNRARIKKVYQDLLAEQQRVNGIAPTIGTARNAQQAVKWAMDHIGAGGYSNLCLMFVDDAYGASSGRVGTAIGQWYRAKAAGYGHPGDRNAPLGAQIFYWTGNSARHIAIVVGPGLAVSTDADNGRVGLIKMSELETWGDYVGWAPAYYG